MQLLVSDCPDDLKYVIKMDKANTVFQHISLFST